MNHPDHHSLRSRLGESQFQRLSDERYLELLQIVQNSEPSPERTAAKEVLFETHLQQIVKAFNEHIKGTGVFAADGVSGAFNEVAAAVYKDLSRLADKAKTNGKPFSFTKMVGTCATWRAIDQFNKQRRTLGKEPVSFTNTEFADALPEPLSRQDVELLGILFNENARQELKAAVENLSDTEREVIQALHYGEDTDQDLNITRVAETLGKPRTTVQSAYTSGIEKLKKHFENQQRNQQ